MSHASYLDMTFLITWLIVGLVAGLIAGFIVGGYGIFIDVIVGMIGAIVGGLLFQRMAWQPPFGGLGGPIFIAFVGAMILLVAMRLIHVALGRGRTA